MSSEDCAWSVRTKVVNIGLLRVNDIIFERIHDDIEKKYNDLRSVEDLRRWIQNLPNYHKEFGNEIESFILHVLEGVKRFCPQLVSDCNRVLDELSLGPDVVKVVVFDALSGERLNGCFLRVQNKEYRFDHQIEVKVKTPITVEVWREGYEKTQIDVSAPGESVVKLMPREVDVIVDVKDRLGPLPNTLVRITPRSFAGEAKQSLTEKSGSLLLKLFNNQQYEFEAFIGNTLVAKETVRIDNIDVEEAFRVTLQIRDIFCRLAVVFKRRRLKPQLTLFEIEERKPEFLLEAFKIVLYDENGNLLGQGYNGEIITLSRLVNVGERLEIRAYPLDKEGKYLPNFYVPLKMFMESGTRVAEISGDQRVIVEADIKEVEEEGLTLRFRNTTSYKNLKKEVTVYEVELEESAPKTSEESFNGYLGWFDCDKVKVVFGGGEERKLYKHQYEALEKLERSDGIIVFSGMASGKTEIAVLYLLRAYKRDPKFGYAVVVYPTRELLRDQYGRWKRYFDAAYDLGYLPSPIEVVKYYGEIAKRPEGEKELEKIRKGCCVILTTASTFCGRRFLRLLKQPPRLVVLDEVHFYRSFDLTVLMEFLRFAKNRFGGFEKFMFFSATIGDSEEFCEKVNKQLEISCSLVSGEAVRGRKTVYLVDLSGLDENYQEAEINKVLEEYCKKSKDKTILFARNRREAEDYDKKLRQNWHTEAALHIGDVAMVGREAAVRKFRIGRCKWMVTVKTLEVGIDIGDVSRIIHLGLPPSLSEFMQREGRSGRRGQEAESLIFARSKGDFERIKTWLEELKSRSTALLSKLAFNPYSLLAKKIREISISGKWPEKVKIGGVVVRCKVFGGSRFKLTLPAGLKGKGEVYIRDIIFRYLPYSVRLRDDKKLFVKKIDVDAKSVILDLVENNDEVYKLTSGGFYATTSGIETVIEENRIEQVLIKQPSELVSVKIRFKPLYVNFVWRRWRTIYRDGEIIEVPYYYIMASYPVPEDVTEKLEKLSEDYTRGFLIDFEIPKDLVSDVVKWVVENRKAELEEVKDEERQERIKRIIREVMWYIESYLHLAVHLLVNVVTQHYNLHPEEIEHYVRSGISLDEILRSEIIRRFAVDWGVDKIRLFAEELSPKLSVKIVIGNKVDFLKDINWHDEEIINSLKELRKADLEKLSPYLESHNCFVKADVEDLGKSFGEVKVRSIICELAEKVLKKVQDSADKLTVY
jgi:superfamily II DNA/RNA helicase